MCLGNWNASSTRLWRKIATCATNMLLKFERTFSACCATPDRHDPQPARTVLPRNHLLPCHRLPPSFARQTPLPLASRRSPPLHPVFPGKQSWLSPSSLSFLLSPLRRSTGVPIALPNSAEPTPSSSGTLSTKLATLFLTTRSNRPPPAGSPSPLSSTFFPTSECAAR